MLIKLADDKSKRLALLQDLQKSSLLDARQKEWLRKYRRSNVNSMFAVMDAIGEVGYGRFR